MQRTDLDPHLRPQPDESDVRPAGEQDVRVLASRLGRAFRDNPGAGWVFPNEARRLERLERGFALFLRRLWLGRGEVYTTDRLAGAAIWLPPGRWKPSAGLQLRLLPGVVLTTREEFPRFVRFFNFIESQAPARAALVPEHPGRRSGSAGPRLRLPPAAARCCAAATRSGLPAYLETDTERNVALYQRHGFRITEELPLPGGGPPFWLMWRDPA